jgi:hypothetical protein
MQTSNCLDHVPSTKQYRVCDFDFVMLNTYPCGHSNLQPSSNIIGCVVQSMLFTVVRSTEFSGGHFTTEKDCI